MTNYSHWSPCSTLNHCLDQCLITDQGFDGSTCTPCLSTEYSFDSKFIIMINSKLKGNFIYKESLGIDKLDKAYCKHRLGFSK